MAGAWATMKTLGRSGYRRIAGNLMAMRDAYIEDLGAQAGFHPLGAPDLTVRTALFAGGVVVLPASTRGLSTAEKVITQASRGVPGGSETGDKFGRTVASADFDRDGYADLHEQGWRVRRFAREGHYVLGRTTDTGAEAPEPTERTR